LDWEAGPRPASQGRASGGMEGKNSLRGEPAARNGRKAGVEEAGRKAVLGREEQRPRFPHQTEQCRASGTSLPAKWRCDANAPKPSGRAFQ
jgi:hypothetical protein